MTTREEIEAAAAKAGLRVSSALPSHADGVWEIVLGRYLVEFQMDTGRAWAYRTESGGTLVTLGRHARIDGAFAAIAADIDKIAACRVRPADDIEAAREQGRAAGRAAERADVVAWLEANAAGHDVFATLAANESTRAEQATASRVAMTVARKIESGRHVGAATVSPEPKTPWNIGPTGFEIAPAALAHNAYVEGFESAVVGRSYPREWVNLGGDEVRAPYRNHFDAGRQDGKQARASAFAVARSMTTEAVVDQPDPLALPEGMEWRQDGKGWKVTGPKGWIATVCQSWSEWAWAVYSTCFTGDAKDEHAARCALAAHLRESAEEGR